MSVGTRGGAAALIAALALGVAACGSDNNSSSSSGSSGSSGSSTAASSSGSSTTSSSGASTTAAKPTGKPIKVYVTSTVDSPAVSLPETFMGAESAANAINAAGGVKGRPIQITTCDDKLTPAGGVNCVRKAVADHAVAVQMTTNYGPQVFSVLDKAGIPAVGDSMFSRADFTDPGSFPLVAGSNVQFLASPLLAKAAGKKSIASLAFDIGNAIDNANEVKRAAQKIGMPYKGTVKLPLQATDYAPYIQQLKNMKPDAVVMIVAAAAAPNIWKAAQQLGLKTTWVAYPDVASDQVIKAAGNLAEGMLLTSPYPVPSDPKFAQYNKELDAAKAAGIKYTERRQGIEPVHPWLAIHAIAAMGEKMSGELNAQTLTEALKAQTTPINVGGLVDWNPSIKGPSDYPRVGNGKLYFEVVKNGKLEPYGPGSTNVYQALGLK